MLQKYDYAKKVIEYLKSLDYVNCHKVDVLANGDFLISINVAKTKNTAISSFLSSVTYLTDLNKSDLGYVTLHITSDKYDDIVDYDIVRKIGDLRDSIYKILNPPTPLQEVRDEIEQMLLSKNLSSVLKTTLKCDKIIIELKNIDSKD